jgi:putative phosphoesterase
MARIALRIGLISDTHGLLRPEALAFLEGCERIIHAGDIGDSAILDQLAALAPLTVVRGNNDRGPWAEALPEIAVLQVGTVLIQVIHDLAQLPTEGPTPKARVVVSGHSHVPAVAERAGVIYVNPGSAGPRRFKLPVSVGELRVEGDSVSARLVTLEVPAGPSGKASG